jgi:prepilin-type N-terminal cleavage/methylation domain-containing protein
MIRNIANLRAVAAGDPRRGFTLIEVTLSLLLMGILAAVAGMTILSGTRGHLLARDATRITQQGSLAMARIARELMELEELDTTGYAPTATSITYERSGASRTLGLVADQVRLGRPGGTLADGDVLIAAVAGFSIGFYQRYTNSTVNQPWDGVVPRELALIHVRLDLLPVISGFDPQPLEMTVYLRNNRNRGGNEF